MKKLLVLLLTTIFFIVATAQHDHDHPDSVNQPNSKLLDSIKNLVGNWKGSFKWLGTASGGEMDAKYYLTGNGTAVIEDLISEGNIVMTSVYHADGTDLRATHYCGAGNQPRFKANSFDKENKSIDFQLIDITNLRSPDAGYVHALELRFEDANHLKIFFKFIRAGVEAIEQIDLSRLN